MDGVDIELFYSNIIKITALGDKVHIVNDTYNTICVRIQDN